METQVEKKVTVKAESANHQFPTVMVERIHEPRKNPDYYGIQMRWVTQRKGNNVQSRFLGGAFAENRVTVQTMHKDIIEQLDLTVGANINELFKAQGQDPIRLSISELTQAEFDALDPQDQLSYSPKTTPDGEELTFEGKPIYRKVFVDEVDGQDKYVKHDNVITSTASIQSSEQEEDLPM